MTRLVPMVMVVVASSAFAVAPGGPLYVACKDLKLLKDPKPGSKPVSPSAMGEGDEVKWLGASAKDKAFHEVEYKGKKGYVHMGCLKPSKPMLEVTAGQQPMSQEAFAASASTATPRYQGNSDAEKQAAADLEKLEALNKNITPAAIAEKERELHGGK